MLSKVQIVDGRPNLPISDPTRMINTYSSTEIECWLNASNTVWRNQDLLALALLALWISSASV